jgi:Ti-type conjugative transfer relaxase TraA
MAIYHFSAKVISRANGSSALAAAAYRSASRLRDERLDRHHDFSNKAGVVHSEVMLPDGAPEHLSDRERLWSEAEAAEKRIDAQLARELDAAEGIRLAREFVSHEFVSRGMIADLNVHWDIGADGEPKPHAHVMLTMRAVDENGFGAKVRDWNRTGLLEYWRERWAGHVNQRLAELDIDTRVDHRSLEAQGIELEPQHKIGGAAGRMAIQGLSLERIDEHRAIAHENGDKLLANPALALDAIIHQQATFTTRDLAMFVHRHSDGRDQFDRIMTAVRAAPELVALGRDGRGNERFTSRAMLQTEQRLERAAITLDARRNHAVADSHQQRAITRATARGMILSTEQRSAFEHVTNARGLSVVIGYAGSGKSAMLGVAHDAWEAAGYRVQGAALSGIAAENLEHGSGIEARTIASLEHQWAQGRELLLPNDVLVIDEAGMIGSRQMERVISEAEKRGAKLVLVGDPEQLQAIEAGAAFRSIAERHGSIEITDIRRQREDWQRQATRQLATGRTAAAIAVYDEAGHVHVADTREQARTKLIDRWDADRMADPAATRLILTHTNDKVRQLNGLARERLRQAGELGEEVMIRTERGSRAFAPGDRIMFLKNERSLGVKNGSLGRVESVTAARMAVQLDDDRTVAFDPKDYSQVDHGYAATIHKAQGVTVDRVHVLATPGMDRHAAYVALSRHREGTDLHYGRDDFADRDRLVGALSRERGKDMASDYVREFADRRAIVLPVPPARQLDMFEGLAITPVRAAAEPRRSVPLHEGVVQFAKATTEIVRRRQQGLDATPGQEAHFQSARRVLDELKPGSARDLRAAFVRDMGLIDEAAAGNSSPAIGAMNWERRYRIDPEFRAEHFVKTWRQLGDRHEMFERRGDDAAARKIAAQMTVFAKTLERDPQLESLLRNRKADLGLPAHIERPFSQALPQWIGWGRGRGLER